MVSSAEGSALDVAARTFVPVHRSFELEANASVVSFIDRLVAYAHELRASDIHLDPQIDGVQIRFRVDGALQKVHLIPSTMHHEVISRIKILCGLRTDEHQAAQDGRFRLVVEEARSIDVRVSIVPTYHGENAVLRLLAAQAEEFNLESLGFSSEDSAKIMRAAERPHGMILATGPTGSGKTTTLYTLVKMLNLPGISIITIEDPIEYAISGINQIQVNAQRSLTFGSGLRSLLRQDPNVIMVGEIRDTETAGLAVNTALTGHLVLSTLHTNDAPTTLPRLLDMKVEPYLIASTVSIAIGQRLARRICANCREAVVFTEAESKSLADSIPEHLLREFDTFYRGAGCQECNGTGYRGRIGMYEVLELDSVIREAILRKDSASVIRAQAIGQGMRTMVIDGFCKAARGETTLEEVLRMRYE